MTPPFPYGGSVDLGSSLDAEEQTAMHDALHHCAEHPARCCRTLS